MKIGKILIANRGEIAVRIIRTAKEMGIGTVAVYSDADRNALHVRYADEAVHIGASPSAESYLKIEKIIEACKATQVDAVHPGYGFLSENADFARQLKAADIKLIGPSPESIETMGDKLMAKAAVKKRNVPLVPGSPDAISDITEAKIIANKIGYPVLIKASAGGGGKGMRIVENENELEEQMQRAISEAQSAFGSGLVFIEKFVTSPSHIEFQILGDQYGNVVHLFDRECSVQRRHQKVIEEAPSPKLSAEKRAEMGKYAVEVAKACNYEGAGTVEFVVDKDLNFYFLEMNTRLQVEHPVTELITQVDLVKEQIKIAQGEKLSFEQKDLKISGHAIEVRVYAEDPANSFLPDTGTLHTYRTPQGPGVRVDDGYEEGMEIPIFYDPMIAKLCTFAQNREGALKRMLRVIDEYHITGISTTLDFCRFVFEHPSFTEGGYNTKFIEDFFSANALKKNYVEKEGEIAAAFVNFLLENQQPTASEPLAKQKTSSKWKLRNH
ncbi:acetyl-CoA carboxylase biotin carboxylase subunit [Flammeovirgaceae bacterium SG7u.111]|nr:acetyl-CoA carboxylase biotin carboxylase subunit [Flammeovirgaceae bacterium SG7u.111]